jgi:ABC-type transport system substrate-binding protein
MKRAILTVIASLAMILALSISAYAGGASEKAAGAKTGTPVEVRVRLMSDPKTLDPTLNYDSTSISPYGNRT